MSAAEIATCQEVDSEVIREALAPARSLSDPAPRERAFALIRRMASISKPRQGAFRALLVFAEMARCDWLDGQLELRLERDGSRTVIEVLLDDGLSLNRLHPPLVFDAPFEEFALMIDRGTRELARFSVTSREPSNRVWLRADVRGEGGFQDVVRSEVFRAHAGDSLQRKPTKKLAAVRIPPEAFRDDESSELVTERPPAPRSNAREQSPRVAETYGADSDDIDAGWD